MAVYVRAVGSALRAQAREEAAQQLGSLPLQHARFHFEAVAQARVGVDGVQRAQRALPHRLRYHAVMSRM